jgi:hypothetical protein
VPESVTSWAEKLLTSEWLGLQVTVEGIFTKKFTSCELSAIPQRILQLAEVRW